MQMASNWTTLPIARKMDVRYEALRNANMMVGRRRATETPLADTATSFLKAAEKLFERLDHGVCTIHQKRRPINGNVELLQWADDLTQDERELLEVYKKVTGRISGAQGIRRQFNYKNTGLRIEKGDVIFFTVTPDRRHSALVFRLMRARRNDTGLLADDAATGWRRRFAGPNAPSLFRLAEEDVGETIDVLFDYSKLQLPSVEEAVAMSARDPLSTVLHYDVAVRVLLAWVNGLRMCLHCPDCSKDSILSGHTESMQSRIKMVPCQNKFGNNARIFGGTHGMAESMGAATENQGNDTPHTHGVMAVVTPYQFKSLADIRAMLEDDLSQFERIKRFIGHMCTEDHFDNERHQGNLESLERAKAANLAGLPHMRLCQMPGFYRPQATITPKVSLWQKALSEKDRAAVDQ